MGWLHCHFMTARDEGRREPGWLAAQFRKVRDRPAS